MTRIPLPGNMIDSLLNGVRTGSAMYTGIMNPILQREKNKQLGEQFGITNNRLANQFGIRNQRQAEQFAQEMALKNKTENRMGSLTGLRRQELQQKILEHKLKTDPKMFFEFIQKIKQQGGQMPGGQEKMPSNPPMTPFSGGGMPSNEEIENPTPQMPQQGINAPQQQNGDLFGNLTPDQQFMLQMNGIKIPTVKENPEQKRYADLQSQIALENYKTQNKKIIEQEKNELKNEEGRQEVIDTAKSDLPHLEANLEALNKLELITKNNPNLFGHNGFWGFGSQGAGERFAKTTDNPNAGAFQALLTGPIAAGVKELSGRSNQLALKTQLGFKPSFEENQGVALSKIKEMKAIAKKQIEHTRKLAGIESKNVVVIDPTGKRFNTTESNATHLPKGWKRG